MTLNKYYIIMHNYEKCSEAKYRVIIRRPSLEKCEAGFQAIFSEIIFKQRIGRN